MANATATTAVAPLTLMEQLEAELNVDFDPQKKYMFELAVIAPAPRFPVVEMKGGKSYTLPNRKFKPFHNIVLSSQIVFQKKRVGIRYYDGCDSIFVSEQPKDKEILDMLIKQTQPRAFLEGKFGAMGYERMLLIYLMVCSWNANSTYRTNSANQIFIELDNGSTAKKEAERIDMVEKALELSKTASKNKMLIHSAYLGIPDTDYDSGNERTPDEIRADYRLYAMQNPDKFISTYGNRALETKFYINKAWSEGKLNNKLNKNKVVWAESNQEICDISGIISQEGICAKLLEHAQLSDGEEFVTQLHALYNS